MSFFKNKSNELKEIKINEENVVVQPTQPTDETTLFWIDTNDED